MPYTITQLKQRLYDAILLTITFPKIDTLVFRKELLNLTSEQRKQLKAVSKGYLNRHPILMKMVKDAIDNSEFSSAYYHNSPRKFRGAYKNCIYDTFAGLMAI